MNKNDEWYTPSFVMDKVREVLGTIELDAASCAYAQQTVRADHYFTEADSGLDKDWVGNVWCNPPYSIALLRKFTDKFVKEYEKGNMHEGILLTNSGTDTLWNKKISEGLQAYTVGRISFIAPDGTEKGKGGRGQVFTYFGPYPDTFIEVFTRDDFCWIPNLKYIKESV